MNFPNRKEQRRKNAIHRNWQWEQLSLEEQLQSLNSRLGYGLGAEKQRAKIKKQIQERDNKDRNNKKK